MTTAFGTTAAALQIAGQLYSFVNLILEKWEDKKALRVHCKDADRYIGYLKQWETTMTTDVAQACHDVRSKLELLVTEIKNLQTRRWFVKAVTCLKLYDPKFRQEVAHSLIEFLFRMSVYTQESVQGMDKKLDDMTKRMEKLQIAGEALKDVPDVEAHRIGLQNVMDGLSNDIQQLTTEIAGIRKELRILDLRVPQIQKAIIDDGQLTRERIKESTREIIQHRDSMTRLEAEILPIEWYDELDPSKKRKFRIWLLDNPLEDSDFTGPDAQYNGLELSAVRLNDSYDDIMSKPHIADDVDCNIREKKRCRVDDVSPYIALAKRGNNVEELREYVPPAMRKLLSELPIEVRKQLLKDARTHSQESWYDYLNRAIKRNASTLQDLHILKDMERAILALHAEKLEVTLGIFMRHKVNDIEALYQVEINIKRYVFIKTS